MSWLVLFSWSLALSSYVGDQHLTGVVEVFLFNLFLFLLFFEYIFYLQTNKLIAKQKFEKGYITVEKQYKEHTNLH